MTRLYYRLRALTVRLADVLTMPLRWLQEGRDERSRVIDGMVRTLRGRR